MIAAQGYKVELLPYCIQVVADYGSIGDLLQKRLRWIIEMRDIRPWGHFGLLFTQGLLWWIFAMLLHPSTSAALCYFGLYLAMRATMTWIIGIHGLDRKEVWSKMWIIPVWDAAALCLWLASFLVKSFRWRGGEYQIRDGLLFPVVSRPAAIDAAVMREVPTSGE
jgi:ceramide glucosyltransferase